jgi:hypothetical protein
VRVRILTVSRGILNGLSLSQLLPGLTYEVPVSLGTWLVSQGAAEEDMTSTAGPDVPIDVESAALSGGVTVVTRKDRADDGTAAQTRARTRRH